MYIVPSRAEIARSRAEARAERARTWALSVVALAALRAAVADLEAAGVPAMPVKGIALGAWLYDDPSDRPYVDVDILVPASTFVAASRRLARGRVVNSYSEELLELNVLVEGFQVELHGAVGRRDLLSLSCGEIASRATPDVSTFGVPVLRIDELDHLLLVAANIVKDGFRYVHPHRVEDLRRLLRRNAHRLGELVDRAKRAGFATGLLTVADCLVEEHGVSEWKIVRDNASSKRSAYRWAWALARRADAPGVLRVALGCCVNDSLALRVPALGRLGRRGFWRACGRDPDWPGPTLVAIRDCAQRAPHP